MSVCFVSIGLRRYECRRIFLFYREEDKVEWLYLGIAGAMEVLWSTFLKFSEGFTKPMPTVITLAGLAASMFFLAKAAKVLPIGTAYGIWTGIGALGAVIVGIVVFKGARDGGENILRVAAARRYRRAEAHLGLRETGIENKQTGWYYQVR